MLCAATLIAAGPARAGGALPTNGQYVAGQGSISSTTNNVTVNQTSSHGIINWQGFSIGQGNSVLFNNGSGATLNRVTGGQLSSATISRTARFQRRMRPEYRPPPSKKSADSSASTWAASRIPTRPVWWVR